MDADSRNWDEDGGENGLSRDKVYLIGDLAALTGLSPHTINFYIKLGLVTDIRRSPRSRYRLFGERALEELRRVIQLRQEKRSLKDILERKRNGVL